jgi:hypothetical protein
VKRDGARLDRKVGFGKWKFITMKTIRSGTIVGFLILSFHMFCSCGYQMVKEHGIFGGDITSLTISVFKNRTFEPHASSFVTDAFTRELISTGLLKVNRNDSDSYLEGVVQKIKIVPFSMDKDGVVVEKNISLDVELSLFRKNGAFVKRWTLSESVTYRVDNMDFEDYNKRDALRRVSGRMARKFTSIILIDY